MKKLTRRDFLKLAGRSLLGAGLLGLGGWAYATRIEPGWLEVNLVRLPLPGLGAAFRGFRLAQLSDIHIGGWMDRARLAAVVNAVLEAAPDAVALTGDYVSGHRPNGSFLDGLADLRAGLTRLSSALPVYGVLGNHDYWTDPTRVRAALAGAGVRELTNHFVTITRGSDRLHIAGLDDAWEGDPQVERVAAALPAGGVAILLAHEPDVADRSAKTGRFALQLSGHTHGGQVVLPFIGPPVLPYLGHKYPCGLYRVDGLLQYTNRGVGMAGLEVRFNCRPEVTVFILEPGES